MQFQKLSDLLDSFLEIGIPGVDCVVYQDHEEVFRHRAGYSDLEQKLPITGKETYFLFSCSKVVTCAAALTLLERGKFLLTDPLAAYIPEFSEMVLTNGEKAKTEIKIRDLFTMSAGFTYDIASPSITQVIREKDGRATTLDVVRAIAKEPLSFEPGTHWQYSLCHDVLAGLVEGVSGKRFGEYVTETIFEFEENGTLKQFLGGYSDYFNTAKTDLRVKKEKEIKLSSNEQGQSQSAKKQKLKFSYNEQREFREIDSIIEALEVQIQTLSREIEASSSDYDALTRLLKEKEESEQLLEQKMERWFYLHDLAEQIEAQKQ